MSQEPYFHSASGTVRFWVEIDSQWISASIGKEALHYNYSPLANDDDPLETFTRHAEALHTAVRQRIAAGGREPVMLRDNDLRAP
jgi:hypothetical protein